MDFTNRGVTSQKRRRPEREWGQKCQPCEGQYRRLDRGQKNVISADIGGVYFLPKTGSIPVILARIRANAIKRCCREIDAIAQ